ncbi:tRNA epoxyqueuosine(34) reductase QueG [bacterium]|nr:tRNA epoxyqueuosine(34) reductase QueG [bacterium]
MNSALKKFIKEKAFQIGFDKIGFSKVSPVEEEIKKFYLSYLERNYHGEMKYLEKNVEVRFNPEKLFPEGKTIISLATNYFSHIPENSIFSRYVTKKDYHSVIRKKMEMLIESIKKEIPNLKAKIFVDEGKILEKYWAFKSGLGWIGKNTLLITEEFGSWVFLSEIIINLDVEPDLPGRDLCGECRECIEKCPVNALIDDKLLDARKCISYLTIEKRKILNSDEGKFLKKYVFGCDLCQNVCPWNKKAKIKQEEDLNFLGNFVDLSPERLRKMDEEEFKKIFSNTVISRVPFEVFKNNLNLLLKNLPHRG